MHKVYKKLVRDKIPEIIKQNGGKPETRILTDVEFVSELKKKFQEELDEYLAADTGEKRLEEMADIFEVITALNEAEKRDIDEVIRVQKEKREQRGGFAKGIFLESVEESE